MLYEGDDHELGIYEDGYLSGSEHASEVVESFKHRAGAIIEDAQIIMGSDAVEPIRQAFIRNGLL